MRKIISKEQSKDKKRRNQVVVGIILIFVMVFSILGYSLSGNEKEGATKISYNGFDFTKENSLWSTQIGGAQFSFLYSPLETEKINTTLNFINKYADKPLYFYSENNDATTEILSNIFSQNMIVQRVQNACLAGDVCTEDLPIKTCSDNFIIIKKNESNSIIQKDNCVFIEGNYENLTELSDVFLYKILGIQ